MSPRVPYLTAVPSAGTLPAKKYRPRAIAPDLSRDDMARFWSGLMMRRCGTAAGVADFFACTEQTGRNWIDGFACPTGRAVMQAVLEWPEDFGVAPALRRAA